MEPAEALVVLEREAAGFASALRPEALALPVWSCPGWTVGDLALHLGGIHRWARQAVQHGPAEEPVVSVDPAKLRAWFERGAAELASTLRSHPPDQPCWAFEQPRTVRFLIRRQAHETALHRWDVAAALGDPVAISNPLAVDGIDEVVTVFAPRQLRLGRCAAGPERVELHCDSGPVFTLDVTGGAASRAPDAVVSGPAEALLLLLWRRTTLLDDRLEVSGSRSAAQRLLHKPLTP